VTDQLLRQQFIELIPRLRRFARVLTGNMSDADDIVQATLEKAMRNADQWQNGTRLDSWVFAIARNAWIDDRRLARNRTQHNDISEMLDIAGDDGEAEVERRSTQRAVREAVNQLPEEQRLLVGIVILEGYSYREASEMLDIPIGTVMSRISRAKAALAAIFRAQGVSA
jgi:RNA polymerase sigma-70 factor (ECF subfamily)